jgi:hypothetical protein
MNSSFYREILSLQAREFRPSWTSWTAALLLLAAPSLDPTAGWRAGAGPTKAYSYELA